MTQFTWKSGTIGAWGTAADWVGGVVPNATTADVTIANGSAEILSGTSETVDLITLTSSAATLQIQGLLELGGTNDRLLVGAGTLDVLGGGTIAGGTINAGTGVVSFASGAVLQAVTYLGNLTVASGELITENGLTVKTAAGASPGTIVVSDSATFDTETSPTVNETLNSLVIELGTSIGGATFEHDQIGNGGVLLLGSATTINVIGANDRIFDDGSATIINAGIIDVNGAGFVVSGGNSFGNTGTINIAAGASLTENESTLSNGGTINVNGGALILDTAVSLASLGKIALSAAGTLDAVGTLALGGGTLGLTTGTLAGAFANGTINAAALTFAAGTLLDGITYLGNLTIANGQQLLTQDGLTVKTAAGALPGTIVISDNALFDTETSATVNETLNSLVIDLGTSAGNATFEHDQRGNGGAVTLGSAVTLNVIGANDRMFDDGNATIVNAGIIDVNGAGFVVSGGNSFGNTGTINIAAGASLTENESTFSNGGTINVNGGALILDNTVSLAALGKISLSAAGTLDAVGTLALGGGTLGLTTGTLAGAFANGTINAAALTFASGTLLDGITYLGNLTIANGQQLLTQDGLTVKTAAGALPGTIVISDNALFDTETSATVNETLNNLVIDLGTSAGNATFEHDQRGNGGAVTLGSAVTLNVIGANDRMFDDGNATIVNHGIINVNGAGFVISGGATFANAGTINIAAGAALIENVGTFSSSGGTINVNGGTLILDNALSLTALGKISLSTSATLDAVGTLSLGGATLGLTTGTLAGSVAHGTIKAGTVTLASGMLLDGITYLGNLTIASGQQLLTQDGLTVKTAAGALPGTIVIGDNATFDTETSATVNETLNNLVIDLGTSAGSAIFEHDQRGNGGAVTLGSAVTLNVIGANDRIFDDGNATIVNDGTINVNGAGFVISGGATFNNAGTFNIAAGDTINVSPSTFINSGIIEGTGTGTAGVAISGAFKNLAAGVLTGGTFEANAADTLALNLGTLVATADSTLILNGAASEITQYNAATNSYVTLESELTTLGSGGFLEVLGGRNYSTANTLHLANGTIDLGGGIFTAPTIALSGSGGIAGFGTVKSVETGNGNLRAIGGTLDLSSDTIGFLTSTTLAAGDGLEADVSSTLKLSNNKTIAVDSGMITLSGTNSVIESLNTATNTEISLDTTLDDVAAGGVFNLLAGRNFTATANAGSFTNAGKLQLGGGTFSAKLLTESAGASFYGFGTLAGTTANAGTITASGGTLALTGLVSGAGTLSAAAASTLKLTLGGALAPPITGAGTLELSGTTPYSLGGTLGVGTVEVDPSATLSGTGKINALADAGTAIATGGTLIIAGSLTGAGTLSAAAGALVDLKGGGNFSGLLSGAGTLQTDAAITLSAGASLAVTSVLEDANLTLGTGAAITNAAGHSFGIASATGTVTLGGAGTFTNAGTLAKTGAGVADIGATFINSANVSIGSGEMGFLTAVSGSGSIGIAAGATALFDEGAAASQKLNFLASTGALDLALPASFLATIGGFTGSDSIDLVKIAATKLNYSGNQLTILNGTTTVAALTFTGSYTTSNFVLGTDNAGGSLITWKS